MDRAMTQEQPATAAPGVASALTRFRVMAWVVGVMLLVLVGVAMPLRYGFGEPRLSETISPVHGFLYIVYLVVVFDLAQRLRWPFWPRTVGVMLAGTVPLLSFVVERRVTSRVTSGVASRVTAGRER